MRETLFVRLLQYEDKGFALLENISVLKNSKDSGDVYAVNPDSFRQVPNTPFCYWVSERIRRLFIDLPPFENDGRTAKVGLQTSDDFRFVRAWWEAPAAQVLDGSHSKFGQKNPKKTDEPNKWTEEVIHDFQRWCRRCTCEGVRWVPFAKGGEYSPYYADVHLVVNWENEGSEIRNFVDLNTGKINSRPQNTDYFFRPGFTWPRSTVKGLNMRILPACCVFADKGPAGFAAEFMEIISLVGLFNSICYQLLLGLQQGSRAWEVGTIQNTVVPDISLLHEQDLFDTSLKMWTLKILLDSIVETSHAFNMQAMFKTNGSTLTEKANAFGEKVIEIETQYLIGQDKIDILAFDLYRFSEEEKTVLFGERDSLLKDDKESEELVGEHENKGLTVADYRFSYTLQLISRLVGVTFGRFDIRIAMDQTLAPTAPDPFDPVPICSPGMLLNPSGLPAEPGNIVSEEWLQARPDASTLPPEGSVKSPTIKDEEYPIRISWKGILVDDPGIDGGQPHREDIVGRVREVLGVIWQDKAGEIEEEACDLLGVSDLRDYFCKPSGFFQDHLKRYSKSRRKAPIYWPLSTTTGSYTLWLYYHRLNDQTLYTAVNRYVEPKIDELERAIARIEAELAGGKGTNQAGLKERQRKNGELLTELKEFRDELLRVAGLPYKPNLNDGVIINAAPLHKLFGLRSWVKDTAECWKKLEQGEYDWAHMAFTLWPERVKEKSKTDRSLAIAHDL